MEFPPRIRLPFGVLAPPDTFFTPAFRQIRQKAESENEKQELDNEKWEKKRISRKKYTEKFGGTGNYSDLCGVKSTPVVK